MKILKIISFYLVIVWLSVISGYARFDKDKDLLIAQFDSKPDPDDIHAIAALGCILAHPSFEAINFYAVAGAYGQQGGSYIPASELFNMAFGVKNIYWTDAHNEYSESVTRIKDKALSVLQAGGKVYVQEAGQSHITRKWCLELLNSGVDTNMLKERVIVVQHSEWNENKTAPSDLDWVRTFTRYIKVDDGNSLNGTPNYRSKDTQFLIRARNSQNQKVRALWNEADRVIQEHGHLPGHSSISVGGVDFSDCVENWWIFSLGTSASDVAGFWEEFVIE